VRGRPFSTLARLGPDILAPDFEPVVAVDSLRAAPDRELGDALLDQRLVAGVGNIFKSEACFAAGVHPWRRISESSDAEMQEVLATARRLMQGSVGSRLSLAALSTRRVGPPNWVASIVAPRRVTQADETGLRQLSPLL